MKVIIAGSSNFRKYNFIKEKMDKLLSNTYPSEIEIISGGGSGVERLGEKYAYDKCYDLTIFPCRWEIFGIKAGIQKNKEMTSYADALVVFYTELTKGLNNLINQAKTNNLKIRMIKIE